MPIAKDIVKGQKLRKKVAVQTRPQDIGSVFDALDRSVESEISGDIPPELDAGDGDELGGSGESGVDVESVGGAGNGGSGGSVKGSAGGAAKGEKINGTGVSGKRAVGGAGKKGGVKSGKTSESRFEAIKRELEDIRTERRRLSKELNSIHDMEADERADWRLRISLLDSREQSAREELKLFHKKELTELGQVRKIRIVIEDFMRPVPAVTAKGEL